jgi:hypothetical protein
VDDERVEPVVLAVVRTLRSSRVVGGGVRDLARWRCEAKELLTLRVELWLMEGPGERARGAASSFAVRFSAALAPVVLVVVRTLRPEGLSREGLSLEGSGERDLVRCRRDPVEPLRVLALGLMARTGACCCFFQEPPDKIQLSAARSVSSSVRDLLRLSLLLLLLLGARSAGNKCPKAASTRKRLMLVLTVHSQSANHSVNQSLARKGCASSSSGSVHEQTRQEG